MMPFEVGRRNSDDDLVIRGLTFGQPNSSSGAGAGAGGSRANATNGAATPSSPRPPPRQDGAALAPDPPRAPLPTDASGRYKPSMSSQNYEDNESEVARLYEMGQLQLHTHGLGHGQGGLRQRRRPRPHPTATPEIRDARLAALEDGDGEHEGAGDWGEGAPAVAEKALRRRTRQRALLRWLINLLLAVVVETIYLFISYASSSLLKSKAAFMLHARTAGAKYAVKLFFSLLYAGLAFLMVYLVPTSAGSGIPETKAFLNGIRIPNMQSLRTLGAKALGTVFAVAAGLPLGKYGPMIHIGSIVAAFLSRGARGIKQVDRLFEAVRIFSTHAEKRDLVVSGAAAGVTAAFGAPIGGLMLAWEEGSSYWSLKLSWRVFFCAMATLLFTYLVADSPLMRHSKFINQSFVESYAGSFSTGIRVANRDLVVFAAMGIAGGLLGAGFNAAHQLMTRLRARFVHTWPRKGAEVLGVTFFVITTGFLCAYLSESWACRPLPPRDPSLYDEDAAFVVPYFDGLLRLTCPAGHYNEVASLYLNDGVTALRLVFHLPRLNPATGEPLFTLAAMGLFLLPYLAFLVLTFGVALPCGFFVPQLLLGAVWGRMIGEAAIRHGYPTYFGQVRIFAIMGSAAFVGGISRMVLSMTLIMLEATGDLFFLLPIFVVLMVSHWVGDIFTPSIYDLLIKIKGYPFLRPDPPKWAVGRLRALDLMTKEVVSLRPIESVQRIREVLYGTEHHMFPLLYPPTHPTRPNALFGTVMRDTLVVLLQAGAWSPLSASAGDSGSGSGSVVDTDPDSPHLASPVLPYPQLLKRAAALSTRAVARPSLPVSQEEERCVVDLRAYANPSVYYVTQDSSVTKVYRLFRGLGLRHLLVLDVSRNITGILTRYDLLPDSMRARLREIERGTRTARAHFVLEEKGTTGQGGQGGEAAVAAVAAVVGSPGGA